MALLILALALQARGRHAEAEAALVRGVRAHPRLPAFHAALGRLQLELNRPQEALPSFENCVLLEPGQRAHRATLVRLYEMRVFAAYRRSRGWRCSPAWTTTRSPTARFTERG